MRVHVLQHVPFETPAAITPWLESAGASIATTRLYEPHRLPVPSELDFLVVMGGPMSANDESRFPWLVDEKQLIRRAIEAGRQVLGICLGSQLIASALGARVYPSREKEIGWFPVRAVPGAGPDVVRLPAEAMVFHWHGETFDLPAGAILLATSEACRHQAFQVGRGVIGLQYHPEVTPDAVLSMVEHGRPEIVPRRFIQSTNGMLGVAPDAYADAHAVMQTVLSYLTAR